MTEELEDDRRPRLWVSARGFLALRVWVIVTVVVGWNILMLIAILLEGGLKPFEDPRALGALCVAVAGMAAFTLGVAVSDQFREAVVAPTRKHLYDRAPFVVVGIVSLLMLLTTLASLLKLW